MRHGGLILAAGRMRFLTKKNEKYRNPPTPKTHHEIHSSSVTATTSRRRATKDVPRVCPFSPVYIDPRILEIGLVQLSQLVKTTNVAHTRTDRRTDELNNGTLYAPRNEKAFLPEGKKRPHHHYKFLLCNSNIEVRAVHCWCQQI